MLFRCIAAMLLISALPALAADKLPPGVVAKMGDIELKVEELKAIVDSLPPEAKAQLAAAPQDINRVIRMELLRRALGAEARTKGWDKRPEVVAQMERAREQILVASYMNSVARPPETYPTDADVKAAYDQNAGQFLSPKQYRLAQVFVLAPPESDKAAFTKAQSKASDMAARAKVKSVDFAALAKAGSEHAESAAKGGDMGWVAEQNLIPELRDAVASLKKGDVVGPIKTSAGWHVVRLEDVKEKGVRPLPEVRDQLVNALRLRKAQETEQAYITFMTNKTPVVINDAELPKVQTPAAAPK
ncbi:MAG: peptidyl-prolyl cis-trans isomerase [Burkholderiales bacterium]|nr:peptidyl-prolyl cis-trans isomerase [Burkholderiales bacterium]